MSAATIEEVREFVEGLRQSLVVIENQAGGRLCQVMGRARLSLPAGQATRVKFQWTQRLNGCFLDMVLADGNFYIGRCSKNQAVQMVLLRAGGKSYNLCPLRCHKNKGCGQSE